MKKRQSSSSFEQEGSLDNRPRKRCDGESPCGRCTLDKTSCNYGERKTAREKVYPSGYVEMLEEQQGWLIYALQKLYRHTSQGEGWPGQPLTCEEDGQPLTHDLLYHLGALNKPKYEELEEVVDMGEKAKCMTSSTLIKTKPEIAQPEPFSPATSDTFAGQYSSALSASTFSSQQGPDLSNDLQITELPSGIFAPWTTLEDRADTSCDHLQQWPYSSGTSNNTDLTLGFDYLAIPLDDPFASLIPRL
ncbi:hypothetical protein BDV23DRAFT_175024 [Aspergillus alliaceus]|uniref:Zn(2)-C6 fungal-type domain-containing protein n=1 Tax=Petromyces alliaceus TaxID=209559 RepID=A0A5N7BZS2_PETAA|nr:hypothetical protein BDV23DRAFT_175024 [Aspergillus alliaceus]